MKKTLFQLKSLKYFIIIHLKHGFLEITFSKNSENFITPFKRLGVFEYLVMLFAIYNKPTFWQHLINNILFDSLCRLVQTYLDDIFINSKTHYNYYLYIKQILKCLKKAEIYVDINKNK